MEIVAADQGNPRGIVADGDDVYWTANRDGELIAAQDGGAAVVLGSGSIGANELALFGDHVYWTAQEGGSVQRVPRGGGATELLSSGTDPLGIAVNDTHVYFTSKRAGRVLRVPLTGGPFEVIAEAQPGPTDVALAGDTVFWINRDDGSLVKVTQ